MTTTHQTIETTIGALTLVAQDGVLGGIYFPGHRTRPDRGAFGAEVTTGFEAAERQIREYLAGERTAFHLPTVRAGSGFERQVWERLDRVPYGATTTYGAIARELGDPSLARTVGRAVGRNPLSLIVPCHRVLGGDGALTGYAGGLDRKRRLLALEAGPGSRWDRVPDEALTLF